MAAVTMRYAQTMAFTTLVFFSLFTVFKARSDERSAFAGLFSNKWLWGAVLLSLLLEAAVIYLPFLQQAFSTVALSATDWLRWLSSLNRNKMPDEKADQRGSYRSILLKDPDDRNITRFIIECHRQGNIRSCSTCLEEEKGFVTTFQNGRAHRIQPGRNVGND